MKFIAQKDEVVGPIKVSVPKDAYYLCFIRCVLGNMLTDLSVRDDLKSRMILSLDEACSNLIKHESKCEAVATIDVTLLVKSGKITMDIHNFCSTEDMPNIKPPTQSKLTPGGLGIMIIKKCVDTMEFLKKDNRMADLRLIKKL